MFKKNVLIFLFFCTAILNAGEENHLSHIRQLTFTSMGFERAGEAYFSPDERSIIFQAVPHGKTEYQIYVMNLEEGIPRMVSTGRGSCTCGYFRPDGKKIIFASSHDSPLVPEEVPRTGKYQWRLTAYMNIYEANPDGTDLRALTDGAAYHAECAYSSDGREIVYASNEDGSMNLYAMAADGSNVRQLTHTESCYNGGCFFSPDGSRIIFRSDRKKRHYLQLYVINRDGSGERALTDNREVNWAPYWHPDGVRAAFTKSVDGHRTYAIYLIDTESGEEERITDGSSFDGLPVFNHDGSKLMWTSKREDGKSCNIFIADFR